MGSPYPALLLLVYAGAYHSVHAKDTCDLVAGRRLGSGSYYKDIISQTVTPDQCCTACNEDSKCKSFTYVYLGTMKKSLLQKCLFYDNDHDMGGLPEKANFLSFRSAKAPPAPAPHPGSPIWGPGATAAPEKYGYKTSDVKAAEAFISDNVKERECFLMAKNGEIIYESGTMGSKAYDGKVYEGYSMTKTIGFLLILMAATQGELDIDADITEVYGIPSPKTYGVSCRMMMSMVLGGEAAPGELWRYDELGDMWMGVLPKVLLKATGKSATTWFKILHESLELSPKFVWPNVDTQWGFGAAGTCDDWGRFAQLLLNNGRWGNTEIISPSFTQQAAEPVKYDPYNMYSNPCYGLGWWLNPDKQKYKGCCWEASRLPPPNCNNETFIQGGSHDIIFTLGLYGQVVLAIPSQNVSIVSLGRDLRPIEPIRVGVYPGVCKMLGLPCNDPPPAPKPKCGETLECLGMSAQCFSGYGNWSHAEPVPGGAQCVHCFMQRVRDQTADWRQREARDMIQQNCPQDNRALSAYLECFCYDGDNVFAPWPSTTTTTPAPKPLPPVPHPYTTPAPKPIVPCDVPPSCWKALNNVTTAGNGRGEKCGDQDPYSCGICLARNWGPKKALAQAACPGAEQPLSHEALHDWNYTTIGLCFCGPLHPQPTSCIAKVSGVCNMYHEPVTFQPGKLSHYGVSQCTAAAAGKNFGRCQLGEVGTDQGVPLPNYPPICETHPEYCGSSVGVLGPPGPIVPQITSQDGKVEIHLWLNLTTSTVAGIDHGKFKQFTHACGYKKQWNIVIDKSGKGSLFESEDGLSCPRHLESVDAIEIVV